MHDTVTHSAPSHGPGARLGERVRTLRVSAGLTQTQLAGERFSKEYISQIERGKTRPTEATDRLARANGSASIRRSSPPASRPTSARKVEACARCAPRRCPRRIATRRPSRPTARSRPDVAEHRVHARSSSASSPVRPGRCKRSGRSRRRSSSCCARVRSSSATDTRTSSSPTCSTDSQSAGTSSRASRRRSRSSTRRWRSRSARACPCDLLRSDILQRRSRCHRRLRDYAAAHDDVERALELAQDLGDRSAIANAYFQASLLSQRQGHYVLSRSYAQRAKELYDGLERRAKRRPAAAHARRPHASARRRGQRRRASEGVLLEGARHRFPRGRRAGARGDRPGSPEPGGVRPGRGSRAKGARPRCRVGRTTSTKSVRRSSYWDER